jgi:quinol monooxygenase YgiN
LSQPSPFANPSNGLDGGHKGGKGEGRSRFGQAFARPFRRNVPRDLQHISIGVEPILVIIRPTSNYICRNPVYFLKLSIKPQGAMTMVRYAVEKKTVSEAVDGGGLLIVAQWEAKEGQADRVAGILERFLPEAQREPGAKLFLISRARENPAQFLFYELFRDDAAFKAHQESAHFKTYIAGEALPLLAKRERTQYALL